MTKYVSDEDLSKVVEAIVSARNRQASSGNGSRIIVGMAGRPGSGKSTVLGTIAAAVQKSLPGVGVSCMPMDGYHLYKKELHAMKDPAEAVRRRGAEWTFSPEKLFRDLSRIRQGDKDVYVPKFDHGVGDPEEGAICIPASAQIVIVEGNYLLYRGTPEWAAVNSCFDVTIFLQCDREECIRRLYRRHRRAWKSQPKEEAMARARGSDTINGDLIDTTAGNAAITIHSFKNHREEKSHL